MTTREYDVMMAEALTRIGQNVPSLRSKFASRATWAANAVRNHSLIEKEGPAAIASILETAANDDEEKKGTLLPSYLVSIAANLRHMANLGDDGKRAFEMPTEIPEKALRSYCVHLRRYGDTVCRHEYLERFGAEKIKSSLLEHGCDVEVEVLSDYFEPMTVSACERGMNGYYRVAAVQPTVKLTLKKGGESR